MGAGELGKGSAFGLAALMVFALALGRRRR
jgi:MYXO-CTERM domain-containing protein